MRIVDIELFMKTMSLKF